MANPRGGRGGASNSVTLELELLSQRVKVELAERVESMTVLFGQQIPTGHAFPPDSRYFRIVCQHRRERDHYLVRR